MIYFFFKNIIKIFIIIISLILFVIYITFLERKIIAWMHLRIGPNRVGKFGLLQPIADMIKLLFKEIVIINKSNIKIFFLAPVIAIIPSILIWGFIPFNKNIILLNLNSSLLFIISITSLEVYAIILAGWFSNSRYAFLASIRAVAQMISYEISISFCIIAIILYSKTSNIIKIVNLQNKGFWFNHGINFLSWNWLSIFPIFIIYLISNIAETNRHPFDIVECESEIIAGHMVEYSGISFSIFFLAEYINIIFSSTLISLIFLGGWHPPLKILLFIPGFIWLFIKTSLIIFLFIWIRASLPRYKYNQIIELGWKYFIPITIINILIISTFIKYI